MLRDEWQHVRRILAVQLGSLADVMMLSPALDRLQQALPDVSITLLCTPEASQIGQLMPVVNAVLVQEVLPNGTVAGDAVSLRALIQMLRSQSFDAAILFTQELQSPYLLAYSCYLAGIPIRVGLSQEFGGGVLSHWVKAKGYVPTNPQKSFVPLHPDSDVEEQREAEAVDRNLFLLEAVGLIPVQTHFGEQITQMAPIATERESLRG